MDKEKILSETNDYPMVAFNKEIIEAHERGEISDKSLIHLYQVQYSSHTNYNFV